MFETVKEIANLATKYVAEIDDLLKGIDNVLYVDLMNALKLLSATSVIKFNTSLNLLDAYKVVSTTVITQNALELVSTIVDRYDNIGTDMSLTFMEEFTAKRRKIITLAEQEIGNSANELEDSFKLINMDNIKVQELIDLDKSYNTSKARTLFVYASNKIITNLKNTDYGLLQAYIEELKNEILNTNELHGYLLEGMLTDFTMIPSVPSVIMNEPDGVIVKKILPNPIEYNTRYLTDFEFASKNKVMSSERQGLSDEVLIRFDTIKSLDETVQDTVLSIPAISAVTPLEAYETIDGKSYRKIVINSNKFNHRVHAYNNIFDANLYDFIGEVDTRVRLDLDQFEIISKEYKSGVRRRLNEIKRTIIEESKKIIKAQLLIKTPTNVSEMRELILSGFYIIPALTKALYQTSIDDIESMLSQLKHLNSLFTEIERNLKTAYEDMPLNSSVFKEFSGTDLINQLSEQGYVIMQRAVNRMDANKFTDAYVTIKGWGRDKF